MANNYLKVTTEKSWRSQNFDFLSLKNSSPDQFFESSNSRSVTEFLNLFLQLKSQRFGSKTVCGFSINSILKGIMTF